MTLAEQNYYWAEQIVCALRGCGAQHFFIAPGSRSAPLTLVLLRLAEVLPDVYCHTGFDERSLAFAALGVVKASGLPAVTVTSSGSAVANLLPAMVEAQQLQLPLVALTADRPAYLIGVGANQAIHQPGIFSHFVAFECSLPLPDGPLAAAGLQLSRHLHGSMRQQPGPVHLNVPFAEPLYPDSRLPLRAVPVSTAPAPAKLVRPANIIDVHGECLIIAGSLNIAQAQQVLKLAEALQAVVIADITSQLRQLQHPRVLANSYELCTTEQPLLNQFKTVLQFGGRLVNKPVNQFLAQYPGCYWLINEHDQLLDPTGLAQCRRIPAAHWPLAFKQAGMATTTLQQQLIARSVDIAGHLAEQWQRQYSEYHCLHLLSGLIPAEHLLFLGNSLTIRLYERTAECRERYPEVFSNRGASGIDGLLATAAGLQLARGQPLTVIVGDLSALHDLNSLYWLKQAGQTLVLIVLNNDGGQIFSMLPARQQKDVFEQGFEQPHGISLAAIAAAMGLTSEQVAATEQLAEAYQKACRRAGATVIEVLLPRDAFIRHHRALQCRPT
ncbi:2-succinyl-5-enolpyruvyl-6-hydroxy-3-cyclohexene-1-carboxylic-acid synthase [Reinekea marinisedimentorum]|uniref:2-succinyl-5-enolpyruvyl-6-hydroxy-3-cyclohexene-1-carboxylate synthase n=1 Tax=Reinekea marinisedimentorum TaxID=230495 RepID=A0A4R3I4N7_9GAMM|nr:2-succinyl-5-enolpyruvyl-6-hydroxy-3-cyclohexene-1-carboxylic-acid synthase [Reinekea marinisedimentorum]TCS39725.1 2-succinyl-5-enolpyruvyl-6-hydroxy-3-cyclohexene-1-carboxylate synthase [Reinekea marinisedimentorum]